MPRRFFVLILLLTVGLTLVPLGSSDATTSSSETPSGEADPSSSPASPQTSGVNVALASNGGTASASSTFGSRPASDAINGEKKGVGWATSGGWNDNTSGQYPDWLQVDFGTSRTISEIDVFTLQDNYTSPSDPTLTMTFSLYGITAFNVQYWTGSAWASVSGGDVTGNNKVWRKFTFAALDTTKIRINVTAALASYS